MKNTLLFSIVLILSFLYSNCFCNVQSTIEKRDIITSDSSSINSSDSSFTIGLPKIYTNSHLLFGAELIDPFNPDEFLVTATRIWKTDIRVGILQKFKYGITTFLSIRDNDSPQTNNINLYEAGIRINHNWGNLWVGQQRMQSGNNSFYLNDAFDRSFWDQGLIYDYLMRGIGTSFNLGIGKTELFIGSDKSSYFIGGGKHSIEPINNIEAQVSGLYIARDQQYSAFGTEIGIEFKESFEHFFGFQVIGYKNLDQEPSSINEFTIFIEGRYLPNNKWNFGAAYFLKRFDNLRHTQDEVRMSFDIRYQVTDCFIPVVQTEVFRNAGYTEIHLGFSSYLQYLKSIKIVPRIRYIVTEFGPDMGYIGVESYFAFGKNRN